MKCENCSVISVRFMVSANFTFNPEHFLPSFCEISDSSSYTHSWSHGTAAKLESYSTSRKRSHFFGDVSGFARECRVSGRAISTVFTIIKSVGILFYESSKIGKIDSWVYICRPVPRSAPTLKRPKQGSVPEHRLVIANPTNYSFKNYLIKFVH